MVHDTYNIQTINMSSSKVLYSVFSVSFAVPWNSRFSTSKGRNIVSLNYWYVIVFGLNHLTLKARRLFLPFEVKNLEFHGTAKLTEKTGASNYKIKMIYKKIYTSKYVYLYK